VDAFETRSWHRRAALAGLALFLAAGASATAVAPATPAAAASATTSTGGLPDGVPPAARRAEPALPVPAGWSFTDRFPRTSGVGRYVQGAFEWTDYLYDDHGATGAVVASPVAGLAPPKGTYVYPAGAADGNGADLFRIGVAADTTRSLWRVDWTTLDDPSIPIVAFAIDSDGNAATGASSWGAGTGLTAPGIDHVLVVSSRGAWVTDLATNTTTSLGASAVTVDHSASRAIGSFVAQVPRAALPPLTGRWTIRAASGLATADGRSFAAVPASNGALPGEPAVYDLGFDPIANEPASQNFWMENTQAQSLQVGDASAFSATVDWATVSRAATTPDPLVTGPSNRWYVSSIELGKGVVRDSKAGAGDVRPNFLGRVQPYAVYVPRAYNPAVATPLTWMLHSLGVQHNQYVAINPKFVQQACEARGSICATTLGRGPDGWYFDEAELDFWQVWHAVASSYHLDPDRTVLSGYSMGGWATYKLGLSYPDLFAKAVVIAGPQICGIRVQGDDGGFAAPGPCTDEGRSQPLLANAQNLPYYIAQGGTDELVPVAGVIEQVNDMMALGLRVRFELFPTQDHLGWALEDLFASPAANMGNLTRTRAPHSVSLTWYPALARTDWGIGTSGAYWMRDLRARLSGPGVTARVDATSGAVPSTFAGLVNTSGPLVTGDTPPLAGTFEEQAWRSGPAAVRVAHVDVQLVNVAAATVQLARAGFATGEAGTITARTDGATTLTLTDLAPGAAVTRNGVVVTHASANGTARIALGSGTTALAFG
jgi:predicted esterase